MNKANYYIINNKMWYLKKYDISFEFKKIFSYIEEGAYINAIVAYGKRPHLMESITLSKEEALEKGYRLEQRVVQYQHFLDVDLWLIKFNARWAWPRI